MKSRRTLLCVLSISVLSAVRVRGLNCSVEERAYPPSNCLTIFEGQPLPYSGASSNCTLVTIVDSEQFNTLTRYAEILLQSGTLYWTGYRYNVSGVLVDSDNMEVPLESPVRNEGNYDTSLGDNNGMCIAIGLDPLGQAKLFRQQCSEPSGRICSESLNVPTATISTSVSRFLTQGSPINLTCSTANADTTVQWRKTITMGTPGVTVGSAEGTLTIDSFDEMKASYECVATNRAGSVVSQAVVLDSSGGAVDTAPTITELTASDVSVQFGTSVSLNCSFTTSNTLDRVEWFVNGILQSTSRLSGNETWSVFSVSKFSEDGVYQCRVFNENGDNSVEGVFISGRAGSPGRVEFPISVPDTMSQVFVSWLPPPALNVLDPLLLRYNLYYQEGTTLDESTAMSVTSIPPTLPKGDMSPMGVVKTTLGRLNFGTKYTIALRAESSAGLGEPRGDRVIVSTFGTVPDIVVDDSLKVLRTKDNKTLFADWADIKTTPPTGTVARYWVDYRDSNKEGSINSVVLDPRYSYVVISPVEDAHKYQVRVRVGVITVREPLTYSYGPFSKWLEVEGIIATVPPAPPTQQPLVSATGIIAAAVIVSVFVLAFVVLILVVGIVCCCLKSSSQSYSPTKTERKLKRKDSQAISLKPKDTLDSSGKESSPVI